MNPDQARMGGGCLIMGELSLYSTEIISKTFAVAVIVDFFVRVSNGVTFYDMHVLWWAEFMLWLWIGV